MRDGPCLGPRGHLFQKQDGVPTVGGFIAVHLMKRFFWYKRGKDPFYFFQSVGLSVLRRWLKMAGWAGLMIGDG